MTGVISKEPSSLDDLAAASGRELEAGTRRLLQHAVDEAARLLKADGAMVYLVDRAAQTLHFGVDAGIRNAEARELVRSLSMPLGHGLFGTAIERGEVVRTSDYRRDRSFIHSPVADRIVSVANMRSMAVAPLIAEGEALGALGAYTSTIDDFDEAEVALLRALADHAASEIWNARLIARLNASEQRYRFLVENAPDLVWSVDGKGYFSYLSEAVEQMTGWAAGELRGRHFGTIVAPDSRRLVVRTWRAMRDTGQEQRIRFTLARRDGSQMAVEIRAIAIRDAGELVGAHGAMRDMTEVANLERELRERAGELERRVEGQRALAEIAAQITSLRDPNLVLNQTVHEAARLLNAEHGVIQQVQPGTDTLADFTALDDEVSPIDLATNLKVGQGIAGRAIAERRVVWTDDYLADNGFPHTDDADDWMRETQMRSQMAAPLIGETGASGALSVYSPRPAAFGPEDAEMLGALASHAAIVLSNARLYGELRNRVEAQRTLAAIAAEMAALHDPSSVIQRSVAAAARLLGADRAQMNLVSDRGRKLDRPIAAAPTPPSDDDVVVPIGSGVAGMAAKERRVVWTDDYLNDPSFPHDEGDARIEAQGVTSMMSAPLIGPDRLLGTITVQAVRPAAFGEEQAETLKLLADQAAVALTNARLYDELQESERRYRFLVDNSPDMIWSTGMDDTFTFVSGAVERLTGRTPEEVIGQHTDVLTDEASISTVRRHAKAMEENPYVEQRMRIEVPHRDGRRIPVEILMLPTVEDGRITGVHGSMRDISERAALEESLRRQSAVLAHQLESQRRLLQVNETVVTTLDPGTVLEAIADGLRDVVAYDNLAIYRVEDDVLNPVLARDRNVDAVLSFPIPRGEGLTWWSVEHAEPVLLNDALEDDRVVHIPGTPAEPEAIIIVPLISGEEVIGAMNIGRVGRSEVAFTDIDFDLVQLFAGQAAVAITNARLYDQLKASERRYRQLVDNSPDIVWSMDAEGKFTFLSDSLEVRTGWKPEDLIGKPFSVLTDPVAQTEANAAWQRMMSEPNKEYRLRLALPLPTGVLAPVEVAMIGRFVDGRFAGAHGSVRDITERERLEADLRRQAGELAAGQERAHLARELHDSVTQALFSMGLTMRALELLLESDPAGARQKLVELRDLQRDALAEMRTLLFELRPQSLEKDGLVQAIRTHAAAVQGRTGLSITVDAEDFDRLPIEVEEAFYRITQEAIHNIVKHASAQTASVRIGRPDGPLVLEVTDDGDGFEPDRVPRGHLGLVGMRQRADQVSADLVIESAPNEGTTIRVTLLDPDRASAE